MIRQEARNLLMTILENGNAEIQFNRKIQRKIKNEVKTLHNYPTLNEFYENNKTTRECSSKILTLDMELTKQFSTDDEVLQQGVIAECIVSQYIANTLDLDKCFNIRDKSISVKPKPYQDALAKKYINENEGKYFYYNGNNPDSFLLQSGKPNEPDLIIFYNSCKIICEIKDGAGNIDEHDAEIDKDGHLLALSSCENNKMLNDVINIFNKNNDIFSSLGHNIKFTDIGISSNYILSNWIKEEKVHIILFLKNKEIIPILTSDLMKTINNVPIIDTKRSEIRTIGKNYKSICEKAKFFEFIKDSFEYENESEGIIKYYIKNKDGYGYIKGRGKYEVTKYKFNRIFFIKTKDIIDKTDDYIVFNIKNIKQIKPLISTHIKIKAKRNTIKQMYKKGQ